MTELVEFLRARYDERERTARAAMDPDSDWWWGSPESPAEEHIREHRPTYVLADLAAKRRILDMYEQAEAVSESDHDWEEVTGAAKRAGALLDVIRLGALPFAGHPDYRSEWAVAK